MKHSDVMTAQTTSAPQEVLIVAHTGRPENVTATRDTVLAMRAAGVVPWLLADEYHDVGQEIPAERVSPQQLPSGIGFVMVLGGDGTILRAAEVSRPLHVPLLGVNLGKVGFLAEHEREALPVVVQNIVDGQYRIEARMVLDVHITYPDGNTAHSWAVNEATVEKNDRSRMLEAVTEVDGRPVSNYGGDGVVLATPTGSTAYAFSAGGPVVWPEVEALLMVPLCAHALFATPLVAAPTSTLAVEVLSPQEGGTMWCDGRRRFDLPVGTRIEVQRSPEPLTLARMGVGPFTDRLVEKFRLPVTGWRGPEEIR